MRIVQAVFGVFHHFELAHQLHRRNHLQHIYSTWPWARLKREGLPRSLVGTFPILHTSEYLLGRVPFTPAALRSQLASWAALSFDHWTSMKLARDPGGYPDAFIAISGAGLRTGREVRQHGGKFICDRGSTHQRFQEAVVLEEYRRWGVPAPLVKPHIVLREEAIYAQADAITVPSSVARRSFIEMGVASEKVHVIPYGVRLDKFAPAAYEADGPDPGAFDVLFAGGVSLRKGVPYLLESFAQVRHPRKRLTLVGHVSDEVRGLLGRLPTGNVTFTGSLPQPELAKRMARSHVLVLPSVEEGLALVQGQAMACGCPVIATVATGAEDLFTDGVQGFIVPDRDSAALANRMQQLADDPELRNAMGRAALERVKQLGGWDTYGDRWETLLHAMTGIAENCT
jgi:glycosyltransferase involved in cell wall biosynthesis